MFFGKCFGVIHIGANAGEAFEIAVYEPLRFGPWNAQIACQTKTRDTVNDAKVDGLCLPADVWRHLVQRHSKHFRRGQCVNVDAIFERLFQLGNVCDMRQNTQFDLGIIQRDQHLAFFGDERLANAAAFLAPDRDVLQVRIGRRQTPR